MTPEDDGFTRLVQPGNFPCWVVVVGWMPRALFARRADADAFAATVEGEVRPCALHGSFGYRTDNSEEF